MGARGDDKRDRTRGLLHKRRVRLARRWVVVGTCVLLLALVAGALAYPAITLGSGAASGTDDTLSVEVIDLLEELGVDDADESGADSGEPGAGGVLVDGESDDSRGGVEPGVAEPGGDSGQGGVSLLSPDFGSDVDDLLANEDVLEIVEPEEDKGEEPNDEDDADEDAAEDSDEDTETEPVAGELIDGAEGYAIRVAFDEDAGLSDQTTIVTSEIEPGTEEHALYLEQALDAMGVEGEERDCYEGRFFDISLREEDVSCEPQADVHVTIACDGIAEAGPAYLLGVDAQVTTVHFAAGGVVVIEPEEVVVEEDLSSDLREAYAFDQGSFSVTGLVVRSAKVPTSTPPAGAQVAKKRKMSEVESGARYLVYAVTSGTPYAIGSDGAFHVLARTTDGNNIYNPEGGEIDPSLVWTIEGKNTRDNYFLALLRNEANSNVTLYPRTAGSPVVETGGSAKACIKCVPNNDSTFQDSSFYVCSNDGSLAVQSRSIDNLTTGTSAKQLYLAELPTESSHEALLTAPANIAEGYYVISRNGAVNAGDNVISIDWDLRSPGHAHGTDKNRIGGFYNSEIWHAVPTGEGTYKLRNVWSGEYLSVAGGKNAAALSIVDAGKNVAHIVDTDSGRGLRFNSNTGVAYWQARHNGDSYWLYRIPDDGFFHAYFDTTLGGNLFYHPASNGFVRHVQYKLTERDQAGDACHSITLPTAEDVGTTGADDGSGAYRYRLNGWYDVYGNRWYAPGETALVYDNAVFYADWVAATYDIGQSEDLSDKAVYMPAITTQLFDYNELLNARSLVRLSTAADDVSVSGHTERWRDAVESRGDPGWESSYLFIYRQGQGLSLHNVSENERNLWNSSHSSGSGDGNYNGSITAGILERNPSLRELLFDEDVSATGKTYVGADHNLYSYDPQTGYYYYDSNRNAASYNQRDGRFYVYNYTNSTDKSRQENDDTFSDETDFLPLNYGKRTFVQNDGDVNYWFGMKTEFYFFLPNDATTDGTKNKSLKGDDLAFRFSGDDDVWVLVDDQLVLDLGGVHGTVYGEVNFSTSSVTTGQNGAEALLELKDGDPVALKDKNEVADNNIKRIGVAGPSTKTVMSADDTVEVLPCVTASGSDLLANLKAGNHKLTLLYLERGSSESNAAIYFNIAPVYQARLTKVDGTRGGSSPLVGATFKVYTDAACTQEATQVHAYGTTTYDDQVGFADASGVLSLNGLVANQDYYFQEVVVPDGYRRPSGPVRVNINGSTMTGTRIVTDALGAVSEELLFAAELEPQGTTFSGMYGGFAFEVPNFTGREIPEAGGSGAVPLVVAGAALALVGAAGLLVRRRMLG